MIKRLIQIGDSKALLLDEVELERLGIADDRVRLTLGHRILVVSAVDSEISPEELQAAADRVFGKFGKALDDLA